MLKSKQSKLKDFLIFMYRLEITGINDDTPLNNQIFSQELEICSEKFSLSVTFQKVKRSIYVQIHLNCSTNSERDFKYEIKAYCIDKNEDYFLLGEKQISKNASVSIYRSTIKSL